jgi:hypothetical protein
MERAIPSTKGNLMQHQWTPDRNYEQVMLAVYTLRARGTSSPRNQELVEVLGQLGYSLSISQVNKAKFTLLQRFRNFDEIAEAVAELMAKGTLPDLLQDLAARFASDEARELAAHLVRPVFVGSLVELLYSTGVGSFADSDVKTVIRPTGFQTARRADFDRWHEYIARYLDPSLGKEISEFVDSHDAERMGANNLRVYMRDYRLVPQDHHAVTRETGIGALQLHYGPSDWWRIEAFNNRMIADAEFRQRAYQLGWISNALPPEAKGRAPSYVCAHILVTGPDYLVLSQRQRRRVVRYFPDRWSISLEENMQGPREVTRKGIDHYDEGDASLHACAMRGLSEELGIRGGDVDDLQLLGLFAEAPVAAVAALFWARLRIPWRVLCARIGDAPDPEARAIAREPLELENLVRLWFEDEYTPRTGESDAYLVPGGRQPEKRELHPTSRGRLLTYLLEDRYRYPVDALVERFRRHL